MIAIIALTGASLLLVALVAMLTEVARAVDPGRHAGAVRRGRPAARPKHTAAAVARASTAAPKGWMAHA